MRILRAADHKRMPWKNGGGETTEIAVFPEGAGLEDFDWRVSMARVDGDGPFSSFPGIDRTLAILDGAGIVLDVEGRPPARLTAGGEPHAFPADIATSATLIDGRVVDFNVMSRRGRVSHHVHGVRAELSLPPDSLRLILCSRGTLTVINDAGADTLARDDAALLDATDSASILPGADSEAYIVEFRPA